MYADYFGLSQAPFSIAPDPRYLYMSDRHREALAHLLYGVDGGGGFVLLTGEIGAGKTTVCRCFLEQMPPHCHVAYIFNPKLTVGELLASVNQEFGVAVVPREAGAASIKDHVDALNGYLLARHAGGEHCLLIIDEAQNLSLDVLEQLRLLTNLETTERKLLQIILIGQPELRTMLAQRSMEQLAQRVIARFHLSALTAAETVHYIQHRWQVAGGVGPSPFSAAVAQRVHVLTRGVPRRINLLCDRALLGAYAAAQKQVNVRLLNQAATEVFDEAADRTPTAPSVAWSSGWMWLGATVGAVALMAGLRGAIQWWDRQPVAPASAAAQVASPPVMPKASTAVAVAGQDGLAASAPIEAAKVAPLVAVAPVSLASASSPEAAASASIAAKADGAISAASASDLVPPGLVLWAEEGAAWRALAPLWDGRLNAGGDACSQLTRQQLGCFRAKTNLGLIRQLDRPVAMQLTLQGKQGWALLTGLNDDTATMRFQSGEVSMSVAALSSAWRGDLVTVWRQPAGYQGLLTKGSQGDAVVSLSRLLAQVEGRAAAKPVTEVDDALMLRLSAFQVRQGLTPDGVGGPTSFMLLHRATGLAEPRLQRGK
ncbi:ExeA family protein [Ideonella margarita]|uniref:AAA family ATPase n=1 Tax=Ideonella margarita TaxID=2984191 RepID=A0ABU9C3E0_9BURK